MVPSNDASQLKRAQQVLHKIDGALEGFKGGTRGKVGGKVICRNSRGSDVGKDYGQGRDILRNSGLGE